MTTELGTPQIVNGGVEVALGISGLPDVEAAHVLDSRMRTLENQWKRTFIERGLILLEVEDRKLWRFMADPITGKTYTSMEQWVTGAAPYSRRDCFAAKKAVKELRDVQIQSLFLMPQCNIKELQLLSPSDRNRTITRENGETISVIEAAQTMRLKEFQAEISKRFCLKSANARGGRLLGEFVTFRGLQHAPVNEQGVVFLFGMLAHELGFVVEMVTTGFPDCEAKRRVGKDRWERTRIEFEFESRNFRIHEHDPNGCDLIVCWENNWPECPLEVLELSVTIEDLAPNS